MHLGVAQKPALETTKIPACIQPTTQGRMDTNGDNKCCRTMRQEMFSYEGACSIN
jgi:hypothetical protein